MSTQRVGWAVGGLLLLLAGLYWLLQPPVATGTPQANSLKIANPVGNGDAAGNMAKAGGNAGKGHSKEVKSVLLALDPVKSTITVQRKIKGKAANQTFVMPKDVAVLFGGKAANFGDLRTGQHVLLKVSEESNAVTRIRVVGKK